MQDIPGSKIFISPYANDIEYLRDELGRLNVMLELALKKARSRSDDPLRGLYVSDEQAAFLLSGRDDDACMEEQDLVACRKNAQEALEAIDRRLEESKRTGFIPALQRMAENLHLTREELDIIIFTASVELESRYARIFGYLHDDLTRWRPSPGLVIECLYSPAERILKRMPFLPGSRLMRRGILSVADGRDASLSSGLAINPDVLGFITGDANNDAEAEPVRCFAADGQRDGDLWKTFLSHECCSKAARLAELFLEEKRRNIEGEQPGIDQGWICILDGERGSGRGMLADLICERLGQRAIAIGLEAHHEEGSAIRIKKCFLQAAIRSAPVLVVGYEDPVPGAERSGIMAVLSKELDGFEGLAIISGNRPDKLLATLRVQKHTAIIEIPQADYAARKRIWQDLLGREFDEHSASELAARFRLTPGRMLDAYASALSQAALEEKKAPDISDIYEACRRESSRNLSSLAKRIEPRRRLEEIVLPQDKIEQLLEIKSHIKNKGLVYQDWGFERKLSLGRGLNVLFSGSSGTGKTMAAEALAGELGLDLYKIDLSMVVSKYIGETEKNLKRIFDEAHVSNAILFFDEADAIFGKRSEVRDAHDRYANIEISYLLQKMEEHEGIVILASNLSRNMDDAFLRRMHFAVEFPFPEEDYRLQIWKTLLPSEAPRDDDLDLEFLAEKLKLAGGNIKNILVAAAFLAAEDGGRIGMRHLVNAAWKEMRKIGRVCSPADFEKYFNLIESN
jgi:SpoVK/Ycf46/Vps4 family AAA+-type ATPase